jgi:cell division transport system permease protein
MNLHHPIFGRPSKGVRYDIPLHIRLGTEFIPLLMTVMTVLCLLSAFTTLSLGLIAQKWTVSLQNSLTLEIPAEIASEATLDKILKTLKSNPAVKSAKISSAKEIADMLSPWLGEADIDIAGLPLPRLMTVDLKDSDPQIISQIRADIRTLNPTIRIDAHEEWLQDILHLARFIQITALAIFLSIIFLTSLIIGGAVRSRMAIHHTELEILHIMGAEDSYITKQFRTYIYRQAGQGILIGLMIAAILLTILMALQTQTTLAIPGFSIGLLHGALLLAVPLLLLFVSVQAAQRTIMRILREMP